ncbi:MAG: SAF domain-containing protein [Solirubrobacterales bacterium]
MSRRARAVALMAAALACALLAAALAGRYRSSVEGQYGPLRPVVVAAAALEPGRPIGPAEVARSLAVRRVPARFAPVGALRRPQDALGRAPGSPIPAGAYVLSSQLVVPSGEPPAPPAAGRGLRPVLVEVVGAQALVAGAAVPAGGRVDVVVAQRSGLGRSARTYVAAEAVRLLELRPPQGAGEAWSATLAVSREHALELIGAEASGREIRLLPRP